MRAERVRENLERVRERIGPEVEILAATKYVEADDLPALAEAGIELVGENRAQDLLAKQERHRDLFTWDFIGALQSRKLKEIAPNVRLIHSIASESALRRLEQHPAREVLIQVNVAGEESKEGVDPAELAGYIERCPCPVTGLMTMPPFTEDPERQPPLLRPPGRAGRRARAASGCRWAPRRTTRWRWRRARRSCGSAACSTRAPSRGAPAAA